MIDEPSLDVKNEVYSVLRGELLGEGCARETYALKLNPNLVMKVENVQRSFQNVLEWEIWKRAQGTKWEKYFAPCVSISSSGSVLIMDRTEPIRLSEAPKRLPDVLTDIRLGNFGLLNGRVVCHDYGVGDILGIGIENIKMVNVKREEWLRE